ncbi:hypothetical protein RSOLAG1IB_08888 [Rhizoctonia solani AG-1 IB]|uniref:Uncharacterized protein n=1 Tax=Thanatephorus cucumeris (strain AG1-IB / isolate 7/3/14) TaxID=1108050 RepID=A0A0B7FRJ4_THACB|nr:hypothetical protein RSOLAG1IB_08888 [Rhizoctonia solani AG-1 IB]
MVKRQLLNVCTKRVYLPVSIYKLLGVIVDDCLYPYLVPGQPELGYSFPAQSPCVLVSQYFNNKKNMAYTKGQIKDDLM